MYLYACLCFSFHMLSRLELGINLQYELSLLTKFTCHFFFPQILSSIVFRSQNFTRSSNLILIGRINANGQDWSYAFLHLQFNDAIFVIVFRYWSHTVNCSSCSLAYRGLNILEILLQVISIASIGIVAAGRQGIMSVATRNSLVCMAVLCFVASKWLSHFIYKTFRYHDYDHAFRWDCL